MTEFESEYQEPVTTFGKTMKYVRLGVPSILCTIVIYLQESMNLSFAGHMKNPSIMAGIGLGNMTINLFAMAFIDSMNQVIEVLVSQAYGNRNKELCGVYLNRGRVMQFGLFIPISYIILNISRLYLHLGQDEEVIIQMDIYTFSYLPGLLLFGQADLQRKFLNSAGFTTVPLVCQLLSVVMHYIWLTLFTKTYDLGIQGIGISVAMTNGVTYLSLIIYGYYVKEIRECLFWPDRRALIGLWDFLKIAIPLTVMQCTDWWVFELMIFTAGLFGVVAQASQMVMMNIAIILYVSGSGLASVIPSIIGQQIGKGNLEGAKSYLSIIRYSSSFFFLCITVIVYFYNLEFISLLTSIPEVQNKASSISFLLVFNTYPESMKVLQKGIIRSLSLQDKAVYIHLVGNWALNICLQYYFVYKQDMGLEGIWISKIIMETFVVTCQYILIEMSDWNKIIEQSKQMQQKMILQIKKQNSQDEETKIMIDKSADTPSFSKRNLSARDLSEKKPPVGRNGHKSFLSTGPLNFSSNPQNPSLIQYISTPDLTTNVNTYGTRQKSGNDNQASNLDRVFSNQQPFGSKLGSEIDMVEVEEENMNTQQDQNYNYNDDQKLQ